MGKDSGIAWTDHSFNPVWGCVKISPGCANCYAERLDKKFKAGKHWGEDPRSRLTFGDAHWKQPIGWNKKARKAGVRHRVFAGSMCDLFEDHPVVAGELAKLWPLIRRTPDLDWLILTKRPHRIEESLPEDWDQGYPNVWLGVSVEDPARAFRILQLATVPAVVRFMSYEPALGPLVVPLRDRMVAGEEEVGINLVGLDWIIYGGESGVRHRQDKEWWATAIRERCRAEGIAFFFKQVSAVRAGVTHGVPDDIARCREYPTPRKQAARTEHGTLFPIELEEGEVLKIDPAGKVTIVDVSDVPDGEG